MQKRITNLPLKEPRNRRQNCGEVIAEHKGQQGAVMPVLQKAQEIYGYLPMEVQAMVAEGLGVSLEEVFGVSTFYSQFSLTPKGQYNISICLGTACYVKGAAAVMDKVSEILGIQPEECTEDGKFFPHRLPVCGRLRPGPGAHRQRGCIWPADPGRSTGNPGQVSIKGHAGAFAECHGRGPEFHYCRGVPHYHPGGGGPAERGNGHFH